MFDAGNEKDSGFEKSTDTVQSKLIEESFGSPVLSPVDQRNYANTAEVLAAAASVGSVIGAARIPSLEITVGDLVSGGKQIFGTNKIELGKKEFLGEKIIPGEKQILGEKLIQPTVQELLENGAQQPLENKLKPGKLSDEERRELINAKAEMEFKMLFASLPKELHPEMQPVVKNGIGYTERDLDYLVAKGLKEAHGHLQRYMNYRAELLGRGRPY